MVAVKVFIDAEQKVQTDFFLRIVYEECCNLNNEVFVTFAFLFESQYC